MQRCVTPSWFITAIVALMAAGCTKVFGDAILVPETDSETVNDTETAPDQTDDAPDAGFESDSDTVVAVDSDSEDEAILPAFIIGADISSIDEQEQSGVVFFDGDAEKDALQILRDHGFNFARLRLFHDPGKPDGYQFDDNANRDAPYCDRDHTIRMAKRAKALGMGVFLAIHYSDTWADQEEQSKPAAWTDLDFEDLAAQVYTYTQDTLRAFENAGVLPEMVQVGNATTPGMLHPDGDIANWDQLAALLKQGLTATKAVNPKIKTVLHLERCNDTETSLEWFDAAVAHGVTFDIIGQTCYPAWHGAPSEWRETFLALADRYPTTDFIIAEYSYEKSAANEVVHELPDTRGLGAFLWEPTSLMEQIFDYEGMRAYTNDLIDVYDALAETLLAD